MSNYTAQSCPNPYAILIETIYEQCQTECCFWLMHKFGLVREDASDVFQNTMITIYKKMVDQRLNLPATKLKSYLYGVACNKGHEHIRAMDKVMLHNPLAINYDLQDNDEAHLQEVKSSAIKVGLSKLSNSSQTILKLYYTESHSIAEITQKLGYKNHDTTKNMKYKSLQKLKKVVNINWQEGTHSASIQCAS